jgi:hypothetical protein
MIKMAMYKKVMVFIVLFGVGFISTVRAQSNDTPKKETSIIDELSTLAGKFGAEFEKLKEQLALTDKQSSQLQNIATDNAIDLASSFLKLQTAPESQKDSLEASLIKNALGVKEKVFAVLTPAQRSEAEKLIKETIGTKLEEALPEKETKKK